MRYGVDGIVARVETERADTAGCEGLCAGSLHVVTDGTAHPLYPPELLLSARHATRGKSFRPPTSLAPPSTPLSPIHIPYLSLTHTHHHIHPRSGRHPRPHRPPPPPSPSPPLVREIRKTRVISHRGRTEHVSLGGTGRGAAAYDRRVWVSGLWGFKEREGTFYAMIIYATKLCATKLCATNLCATKTAYPTRH